MSTEWLYALPIMITNQSLFTNYIVWWNNCLLWSIRTPCSYARTFCSYNNSIHAHDKITVTHRHISHFLFLSSLPVNQSSASSSRILWIFFSRHLQHLDLQMVSSCQIYSRMSFWLCSYVLFSGQMSGIAGKEDCTSASWLHIPCDWRFLPGAGQWNLQHIDIPAVTSQAKTLAQCHVSSV